MSHRAINWALEQRHLKPGPWIVLIQLGDRHNKDTKQVNPDQFTLADDCNMSRATVNRHLDELETMGMLRRVPRQNPVTKKRLSTFYILGLDFASPPNVEHAMSQDETWDKEGQNENKSPTRVSDCDMGAVSQKSQKPCLKNRKSRVSNCDTNHVREPVKEPCVSPGATHTQDLEGCREGSDAQPDVSAKAETERRFERILGSFRKVYPRLGDPAATASELRHALDEGVDPERILAAAKAYAAEQKGNKRQYVALSENWLRQKRWEREEPPKPASVDPGIIAFQRAAAIKAGATWVASVLSPSAARDLVRAGLVTEAECHAVGVDL